MTTQSHSSPIILQVERAISDLRRGQSVLLTGVGVHPLRITSSEHKQGALAVADAHHPAVQLMKFAGLLPHAVVEGSTEDTDLLTVSAEAIGQYPSTLAALLQKISEAQVPLMGAESARVIAFRSHFGHEEHLAVVIGDLQSVPAPYVRMHSSCVTGDVFGSLRCDCGSQLHKAIEMINKQGAGAILYLSQEGRGIGIANKLRAYGLQDAGMDTVEANEALGFAADERDFALAANMLGQLGLKRITLITNNPGKMEALAACGIDVVKREPLVVKPNKHNKRYLEAKADKLGHQLQDTE
jgi:GTP cyclohydrolase II